MSLENIDTNSLFGELLSRMSYSDVKGLLHQNIKRDKLNVDLSKLDFTYGDGLAEVKDNDKTALINRRGEIVIPFDEYSFGVFKDGYAVVNNHRYRSKNSRFAGSSGRHGVINTHGEFVIECKYSSGMGNIGYGLFTVYEGLININEELIVPFKHESDRISNFKDGYATVTYYNEIFKDSIFYIDKNGKKYKKDPRK